MSEATVADGLRRVADVTCDPRTLEIAAHYGEDKCIRCVAARNPSLPIIALVDLLLHAKLTGHVSEVDVAAWENPSAVLAMLAEPREDYQESALFALWWLGRQRGIPRIFGVFRLSELVELWGNAGRRDMALRDPAWAEVRTFALRLARLFSLPFWSEGL